MSEYALIRVRRFRTPEGAPTCASGPTGDETCKFLNIFGLKQTTVCGARNGLPIFRSKDCIGYTEPLPSCIVWERTEAAK